MIGTVVDKYRITRRLGSGGMGTVWLGEHLALKTPRAIKVLNPELTRNPMIVERFRAEALAAASLKHKNVVTVHDIGQMASGEWFIVYDFLEGCTLGQFIASQAGPIALDEMVRIIAGIGSALQAAHDSGIVHRDIKLDNVFLAVTREDARRPVVLDFGVAKLPQAMAGASTRSGVVIGTPLYMAPEQLVGGAITNSADIFALATIAYQMATGGWFPFQDDLPIAVYSELAPAALYHRQMTGSPVDPRRHNPQLSDSFVRAILAALDRVPTGRPASMRAFVLMLAESLAGNAYAPSGFKLVEKYANDLMETNPRFETIRVPAPAVSRPPTTAPVSGEKLGRKYTLGAKLGTGGMAEVFHGTAIGAEGFEIPVAIKCVLPGYSDQPSFARMFSEEARIAARLRHPCIVQVLDFDRDAAGRLFLVMELIDGKDLASVINMGRIPLPVAIFVITEVLRGLGHAHELPHPTPGMRGVIHRDVSPHNVLLSWLGEVKVSDFGIAKAFDVSDGVRSEIVKGKPAYMSPEQANGERIDRRSDLFAVGIVLWEMLAGRALISGTAKEAVAQILFRELPPPSTFNPDVPPDLEAITMKLLERELDQRYDKAEDVISDLVRCVDSPHDGRGDLVRLLAHRFPATARQRRSGADHAGAPSRRVVAHMTAVPQSTLGGTASQSLPRHPRANPRARWPWLALAGAILGIVGALVVVANLRNQDATMYDAGVAVASSGQPSPTLMDAPTSTASDGRLPGVGVIDAGAAVVIDAPITAAVPVPVPVPDDAGVKRVPKAKDPVRSTEQGEISVFVDPSAEVWIDNVFKGPTPIRTKLRVGRHKILLVNKSKNKRETRNVVITSGSPTIIEVTW
ncbi:MAG: serine/threonine-protein kinase [Kofleriaceae bacterium]